MPHGDKNGRQLPLMSNLVEVVGIQDLIDGADLELGTQNIEDIYSALYQNQEKAEIVAELERRIFAYFEYLKLPDEPTIYDYLVLSLRGKDMVATFNWDPFLVQAAVRNMHIADPPRMVFLHGNTAMGYCNSHTPLVCSQRGGICPKCSRPLVDSRLLYPVAKKDYSADPFVAAGWHDISVSLDEAFIFTIFGYGAPASDVDAVSLLKKAWGSRNDRKIEQIEIIDKLCAEELLVRWGAFIHNEHYSPMDRVDYSELFRHPRRSCESLWSALMMCNPAPENPPPVGVALCELWDWYRPMVVEENELGVAMNSTDVDNES